MSYCRFSCMGWQSAVYAYDDISGGVTIHVASRKRILPEDFPTDPVPELIKGRIGPEEFTKRQAERNRLLDSCELRPIGLSRDGMSWNLPHREASDLIADLRAEGYIIPPGVEEEILESADPDEEPCS